MAFGDITKEMWTAIQPHVQGREVWDLGCGGMTHTLQLQKLGARCTAIDKDPWRVPPSLRGRFIQSYFKDVPLPLEGIEVAFLSWPQNTTLDGLLPLVHASRTVIYVGSNTGGTVCGNPLLFDYFQHREVLCHIPHPRNSLIILGGACVRPRGPLPEEWAATHPEHMWSFKEAVEAVRER
jgi:hypothetical protein